MKVVFAGCLVMFSGVLVSAELPAQERSPWRVFESGKLPQDGRLSPQRGTYDAYHPWQPADSLEEWARQSREIREQILVSNGLWPMPAKQPLRPVIHGKIERDDYTIEKVFFATYPGHYVSGNLYRPKNVTGKIPGVLCPHGHWANGRFYENSEEKAKAEIAQGAESRMNAARFPLQARFVQLARMGCTVFHYDMIGYADSQQIPHRGKFMEVEASLRLQNPMGVQTFNSIRALDFVLTLPEIDSKRIAVTGASGGGTQTFILGAIDPRPAVVFPAVMVSTGMQGGCVCENADYLRIGVNNIAFAALFAPKPMAMTGADDWTVEIATKGLPELKQVYALHDKASLVEAFPRVEFKHNYNEVSRGAMYGWFNTHLKLGHSTSIRERDFQPATQEEMAVFDAEHPRPEDAGSVETLRAYLTASSDRTLAELKPVDRPGLARYQEVVGAAARVMLGGGIPKSGSIESSAKPRPLSENVTLHRGTLARKNSGEQIPYVMLRPKSANGRYVVWIYEAGKSGLFESGGGLRPFAAGLVAKGVTIVSPDVFLTGEYVQQGSQAGRLQFTGKRLNGFSAYAFGFNRPLVANRVRDVLTSVAFVRGRKDVKRVDLIGLGAAGAWTLLARAQAGEAVERTVVDLDGFAFAGVESLENPMMLPGALKYGGVGGLAALAAPGSLTIARMPVEGKAALTAAYAASGGELRLLKTSLTPMQAVAEID